MLRYRLRTLLILMAVGPPMLAPLIEEYRHYRTRQLLKQIGLGLQNYHGSRAIYGDQLPPGARLRFQPVK